MFTGKVLGGVTAAIIFGAIGTIFYFLPESGAAQLMRKAFHLGWPGGLVIVILMLYFQFGRKNDPRQGELVFKSVIGLLGYSMLFIAIANYAMNFNDESPGVPGEPRFLRERAPTLFGISTRALERLKDPRYSQADPSKRDTVQKEACPGCGTAQTAAEYIAESHACPNCYVVAGFGVKGSNDRESPMPAIHKPPIALNFDEFIAVDTWLFAREGIDPPTPEDIENAYKKFIPEADRPKPAGAPGAAPAGPVPGAPVVTGDEPVNEIFIKALCFACHTIPGIQGAVGVVGP